MGHVRNVPHDKHPKVACFAEHRSRQETLIIGGPVVAMVVEGTEVRRVIRDMPGATYGRNAAAGTILGTIGGIFVSEAAQAARFSDCNTGRLAPCRYKVSGVGLRAADE